MRRKDSFGDGTTPSLEEIANCETKTGFLIDLEARQYRNYKTLKFATEAQLRAYAQADPRNAVLLESRTIDKGESKEFFGYSAKHLLTTTRRAPKDSNQGGEEIIDGWYIDHEPADHNCAPGFVRSEPFYVLATVLLCTPTSHSSSMLGRCRTGLQSA
jgi:hypothetical protein